MTRPQIKINQKVVCFWDERRTPQRAIINQIYNDNKTVYFKVKDTKGKIHTISHYNIIKWVEEQDTKPEQTTAEKKESE